MNLTRRGFLRACGLAFPAAATAVSGSGSSFLGWLSGVLDAPRRRLLAIRAEAVQYWSREIWRSVAHQVHFSRFTRGPSAAERGSVIQIKRRRQL